MGYESKSKKRIPTLGGDGMSLLEVVDTTLAHIRTLSIWIR